MKNLILLLAIILAMGTAYAQEGLGKRIIQRSKDQTINRAENRSADGVETGLNKVEEGVGNLFRKKGKNDRNNPGQEEQRFEEYEENEQNENRAKNNQRADRGTPAATRRIVDSKFDFIAGEKVIAYENFERVNLGDFPVDWNTDAGGEVVELEGTGKKWLLPARDGLFVPDFINKLPENFTLEFDVTVSEDFSNNMSGLLVVFVKSMADRMTYNKHFNEDPQVYLNIHPLPNGLQYSYKAIGTTGTPLTNQNSMNGELDQIYHIAMWRQNQRLRVYVDEEKILDLPRAFATGIDYAFLMGTYYWSGELYFSDLKIAAGAPPDTRSKLMTDGKLVTNSITFDVNSDVLKASSYGFLKELAETLRQNPSVRVKVIGHTDSDGNERTNLDLSKRRASAVKNALVRDFSIDASRIETDGKGQSEPVVPNSTPQGKAQNRRVEFIKL
jgi:outer membrane protein OmpA-like peptidoglycan-associated protein